MAMAFAEEADALPGAFESLAAELFALAIAGPANAKQRTAARDIEATDFILELSRVCLACASESCMEGGKAYSLTTLLDGDL